MFTTGTAAKVGPSHNQDLGAAVWFLVQNKVWVLLTSLGVVAPLVEERGTKTRPFNGLQELLGDDGVGVHIGALHRGSNALELGELCHTSGRSGCARCAARCGTIIRGVNNPIQILVTSDILDERVGDRNLRGGLEGRDLFGASDFLTSASLPTIAQAAAMTGDIRCVRPPAP